MTPADRPRILVTRAEDVIGERFEDYTDRIDETGAEPVPYDQATWEGDAALPDYDGVVVTAGIDIDPTRYGEEQSEYVREVAPDRDVFESAVLADAFERDVPVLAICRGHQLFNVFAGGSLLQHIHEREPHRARRGEGDAIDSGWHEVTAEPGTLLHAVFGDRTMRVNSRHHQAVTTERVAEGLTVAATTGDGIVEALERPDQRWALSVQWHPERDEVADDQRPLFEAFVAACREASAD
ncbi:MAG: gamma-glutamyl-gamma-aminobutyrate hydrolase family protein [Chloroflexi bacterium]|nr:gamma-glutamyl-gamma-aminobutyrate hydrolase family protein [Chloroflexota bacterium]